MWSSNSMVLPLPLKRPTGWSSIVPLLIHEYCSYFFFFFFLFVRILCARYSPSASENQKHQGGAGLLSNTVLVIHTAQRGSWRRPGAQAHQPATHRQSLQFEEETLVEEKKKKKLKKATKKKIFIAWDCKIDCYWHVILLEKRPAEPFFDFRHWMQERLTFQSTPDNSRLEKWLSQSNLFFGGGTQVKQFFYRLRTWVKQVKQFFLWTEDVGEASETIFSLEGGRRWSNFFMDAGRGWSKWSNFFYGRRTWVKQVKQFFLWRGDAGEAIFL